jgi:hypothetical protein
LILQEIPGTAMVPGIFIIRFSMYVCGNLREITPILYFPDKLEFILTSKHSEEKAYQKTNAASQRGCSNKHQDNFYQKIGMYIGYQFANSINNNSCNSGTCQMLLLLQKHPDGNSNNNSDNKKFYCIRCK